MPDFTIDTYRLLLETLLSNDYSFVPFVEYLKTPAPGCVILRHDVDDRKLNSLQTARLENELGISGTYYFRMVPESFDEDVIKQIYELGHEVGYHYEDVSMNAVRGTRYAVRGRKAQGEGRRAQGKKEVQDLLVTDAIKSFQKNLETLRRIVPIETICMHGSPLSRWDNRLLWQYYDYHDFGIKGEPYFDLDFNDVLYLTDTGRRWDGDAVSVRDKVKRRLSDEETDGRSDDERLTPHASRLTPFSRFHSTFDIIRAAQTNALPDNIMLTIHPQRWTNMPLPWIRELVWQNIKNAGKWVVVKKRK